METMQTREEVKREKERLKKQRQRQKMREEGKISDKSTRVKSIIDNICSGKKVRANLKRFGITIDMIPCDQSKIHQETLKKLENVVNKEEIISTDQPDDSNVQSQAMSVINNELKLSQSRMNEIFERVFQEKKISDVTHNNYKRDFNRIIELLKCPETDIIPCFTDTRHVLDILRHTYSNVSTYKNMLTPIISLCKYDENFAKSVDYKAYLAEMNNLRAIAKKNEIDKSNNGQTQPWSYYVKLRQQLEHIDQDNTRYLLLSIYTLLPPVRDDYGKVYVSQGETVPSEERSIYYVNTGRLVLCEYKTGKYYGIIDEIIPMRLQKIISQSLTKHPRKYLITKGSTVDQLYSSKQGGKLSSIFQSRFFDFSINDLRHSLEDYIDQFHRSFTSGELIKIRHIMGHNASIGDLYTRKKSIDSDDYTKCEITVDNLIESICCKIGGNI